MQDLTADELKVLISDSYALILKLKLERKDFPSQQYSVSSRNKIKNLAEALREMDEPGAAIPHFIKNAAYSLPRAERGGHDNKFLPFLDLLIQTVNRISQTEPVLERRRKKIQYLIGYINWGAESLCTIFAANETRTEAQRQVSDMIKAEYSVLSTAPSNQETQRLVDNLMTWGDNAMSSAGVH